MPESLKTIASHEELRVVRMQTSSAFKLASEQADGIIVKGFVSTDLMDRDGEKFDPSEFDIEGYLKSPALLCNHALWETTQGVAGGIGRTMSLYCAKIRRGSIKGTYSVWDEVGKREIDVINVSDFPRLSVGVRGLYAFVKVTEPRVIKMVRDGELTAFSWRGVGDWGYAYDDQRRIAYKTLKSIDLWEISLVTVPNNPGSYAVQKSAITGVQVLAPSDELSKFLSRTGLSHCTLVDSSAAGFDSCEVVKMLGELSLLATRKQDGPATEESQKRGSGMAEKTEEKKEVPAEQPTDSQKTEESKSIDTTELVKTISEQVVAKFAPLFEALLETQKQTTEAQTSLTTKFTELSTQFEESKKAAPQVDQFKALEGQIGEVKKSVTDLVGAMSNLVPQRDPREETSKGAPEEKKKAADPNAVFDDIFGIKKAQ